MFRKNQDKWGKVQWESVSGTLTEIHVICVRRMRHFKALLSVKWGDKTGITCGLFMIVEDFDKPDSFFMKEGEAKTQHEMIHGKTA